MHLNVRGAIKNMNRRDLASLFVDDTGRKLSADEAKEYLLDQLSAGREVIPFGPPCEGFDYAGAGCPGHVEVVG